MRRESSEKMRKKIVSIALAGAMVLSLAACGGGDKAAESTTAQAAGETTTADAAAVKESKAAKQEASTAKSPDNDIVIALQADATHLDPHVSSNGVSNQITSIAIPLGATVNMDAVSIVMSFMIMFFANACGINVSVSLMIVILLANVLLSVGTPGIPGGAIASFAALATMAGLPAGILGVYISINTLCDMGATCVNVIGDLACCAALKGRLKIDEHK